MVGGGRRVDLQVTGGDLLHEQVRIDDRWRLVVGIARDDAQGSTAFIPRGETQPARTLAIRAVSNDALNASLPTLERSLQRGLARTETLEIALPAEALREAQRLRRLVGSVLTALAILVLVLGSIGVANTMLMSILTRRHEIALRRALGASTPEIVLQCLLESGVICLLGGVVATVAAVTAIGMIEASLPSLFSLGCSLPSSLMRGVCPAANALRLPVAEG